MRFAWLLLVASCGKLIDETDAGDAAIPKDASEAEAAGDGESIDGFACGEAGHIIYCKPDLHYCLLVKTNKSHDYYCAPLPADCTTPASSKYDCGCFKSGDEIYVTECK